MTRDSYQRRSAFTLVEMMVASALILFMMWIIASAFQKGLESFRVLKTAGDLQEKLRAAATVIRTDLTRPHFNDRDDGTEYLSGQRLDVSGWEPPLQGYFRIYEEGSQSLANLDGPDSDDPSLVHYRYPDPNAPRGHVLQFTVRLKGIRSDQYFLMDTQDAALGSPLQLLSFPAFNRRVIRNAAMPGAGTDPPESASSRFTTVWAEVSYFLRPNGSSTGGIALYSLYRRQNLVTTDDGGLPAAIPSADPTAGVNDRAYSQISTWQGSSPPYQVNTQKTVAAPIRRFGVPNDPAGRYPAAGLPTFAEQLGATHRFAGGDVLLTDVTNFTVKALWEPTAAPQPPSQMPPYPMYNANPDFPFDTIPTGSFSNNPSLNTIPVFDTWSRYAPGSGQPDDYGSTTNPPWNQGYTGSGAGTAKSIPIKLRVRALQIELRIWDVKSKQSRQITIIQDM